MPTKKRILMVNESSHLSTGYSTYGHALLTRLHATGKYEIAEFGCAGYVADALSGRYPWRFYANHPGVKGKAHEDPRYKEFKSNEANNFGRWRFERVLLDFKPDIVFDIRDYWMFEYEGQSPLRPYFHWAIMPTVDSAPQNVSWMETYIDADAVFTYSDWGGEVLKEQGGGKINYVGTASPGVNLDILRPYPNKASHRETMGIEGDINIIGTVMRNQKRKLYPDLFESFAKFIELCIQRDRKDLANNTFLYAHTSFPDMGWSIPELLHQYGVCHKVLFTYLCTSCGSFYPSFFQDARAVCKNCGQLSAILPSTQNGVTREQLADIYNLFDCYVQYSICEGFGMPQVEAIACGVPIMSVDYSAMTEIAVKSKGYLLEPKTKFLELETGAFRVLPDNDKTAEQFYKFLSLPRPVMAKKGYAARRAAEQHYDWDTVAKIWENHFDNIELTGLQGKWDTPTRCITPPAELPEETNELSNEEFVKWLIVNIWQEPERLNSHIELVMLKGLNYGFEQNGREVKALSRHDVYAFIRAKAHNKRHAEDARAGNLQLSNQDFIEASK